MSITQKIMETVVQFMPDKEPDPLIQQKHGYVGKSFSRADGQLKVRGTATFSAEYRVGNLAYASLVYSTIPKGKIASIETAEAEEAPGALFVLTHENAPKMKEPPVFDPGGRSKGSAGVRLQLLQDEKIYWDGQPIAVVVAETQDQADHAAALVRVEYTPDEFSVSFDEQKSDAATPPNVMGESTQIKTGNAEASLRQASFQVDNTYRTPRYNHNAIEPHATIAVWHDEESLTVYECSQYVHGVKNTLSEVFDLDAEKVRAISPFVGGGFGGKGSIWPHAILCAAAAKVAGRPVKLILSREGIFRTIGGRTMSEQRVALGAGDDGRFVSLIHTGTTATTETSAFQAEQFTFPARRLYASESFLIDQRLVNLDTVANTFMRAPGESIGTFALESAIDELAYFANIDPVEIRRINEPEKDPTKGTEFSHRALTEAYRRGVEKFGWKHQPPGSQKDGKWLVGQGVASAFYPFYRMPATARVRISADGTALIQAAAHEMGMGTATVQIQQAAERLGLPMEAVSFEYGDSNLPISPVAGGSNQTASIIASTRAAIEKVFEELLALAGDDYDTPLAGLKLEDVEGRDNGLFSKKDPTKGETYESILKRVGQFYVEAEAAAPAPMETIKYAMGSYGAQFCEVRVNKESGEVRVSRWVGSFDTGKILNPKTATSQFRGGIIMGIGMALTEETLLDERRGRIMNPSLAEYHVPVHLDIPHIEVIYNDIPDEHTPLGAHGIGEIGITGAAAAIANAIFNATGKRIRELPITLDKLL